MSQEIHWFCECCGYALKEDPYPEGIPSYNVCDCCGIEFGRDDYTTTATLRFRNNWIAAGAQWFNPKERPTGWDLHTQLKNARK